MRFDWKLLLLFCVTAVPVQGAENSSVDLAKIERKIVKEPKYEHKPHYSLVVFGPQAKHRSWLVMDGDEILYFDRNGNGDLTDREDKILRDKSLQETKLQGTDLYKGQSCFVISKVAGFDLGFRLNVRDRTSAPKSEAQRKQREDLDAKQWEYGFLSVLPENPSVPSIHVILTGKQEDAQITHIDGPVTFLLIPGFPTVLSPWPAQNALQLGIGTRMLAARNYEYPMYSPLTEKEVPAEIHPTAILEYSPKQKGGKPIAQKLKLDKRCCGGMVVAGFIAPREAANGPVKVTVEYSAWKERPVQPATFEFTLGEKSDNRQTEMSFVMYRDPEKRVGLNEAMTALRTKGLKVSKIPYEGQDRLLVQLKNQPLISISLNRSPEVRQASREIGEGTPHAKKLSECDSRLDLTITPGKLVTEEKETIAKIHAALQEETKGFVYTTWDAKLIAPK